MFCFALLCVHSSYTIISRGRDSWLLCFHCLTDVFVNVKVLLLFLTVTWVSLQCVIVVFPDHNYLFFGIRGIRNDIVMAEVNSHPEIINQVTRHIKLYKNSN